MVGGGQEEEEGDVMNEEKGPEVEHEDDVVAGLNLPQPSVGSRGRGRVRVK